MQISVNSGLVSQRLEQLSRKWRSYNEVFILFREQLRDLQVNILLVLMLFIFLIPVKEIEVIRTSILK